MKKIFISRNLSASSPIRDTAEDHHLVAQSLIEFGSKDFEPPQADWIFFYSRNGVRFFFEKGNFALYPYLWACLGEGTADELSHYITDISFIGEGDPEKVADDFQRILASDDVTCYIRAEKSLDSVRKKIDRPKDFSIPVYSNTPSVKIPKDRFDILIFTSPLNVDAWFGQNPYRNEHIISIGTTTEVHLKDKYGINDVLVASNPTEASMAECLEIKLSIL